MLVFIVGSMYNDSSCNLHNSDYEENVRFGKTKKLWLQIDDSIVMQNFSLKQTLLCVYSDLLATIKTVTSHLHSLFDT